MEIYCTKQMSLPIGAMEINFLLYLMETTIKMKLNINRTYYFFMPDNIVTRFNCYRDFANLGIETFRNIILKLIIRVCIRLRSRCRTVVEIQILQIKIT